MGKYVSKLLHLTSGADVAKPFTSLKLAFMCCTVISLSDHLKNLPMNSCLFSQKKFLDKYNSFYATFIKINAKWRYTFARN